MAVPAPRRFGATTAIGLPLQLPQTLHGLLYVISEKLTSIFAYLLTDLITDLMSNFTFSLVHLSSRNKPIKGPNIAPKTNPPA
jgi:hypothetical protein